MITTTSEFEDETAWERTVLSLALPLMPLTASGAALDLRTRTVSFSTAERVSESDVEDFRHTLLPLLFGAAWKLLDLGLELAYSRAGLVPQSGMRWTIDEKASHARVGGGTLSGFSPSSDLWLALTSLYTNTKETRHALVHRRVRVTPATRELIGVDRQGVDLPPVTYDEQSAFCRAAQRLAQAIIEGQVRPRISADLREQLTLLRAQHQVAMAAQAPGGQPVKVIADLPLDRRVDIGLLMREVRKAFSWAQYVDVELYVGDGRILVGELEGVPQSIVQVDLAALPPWLDFA